MTRPRPCACGGEFVCSAVCSCLYLFNGHAWFCGTYEPRMCVRASSVPRSFLSFVQQNCLARSAVTHNVHTTTCMYAVVVRWGRCVLVLEALRCLTHIPRFGSDLYQIYDCAEDMNDALAPLVAHLADAVGTTLIPRSGGGVAPAVLDAVAQQHCRRQAMNNASLVSASASASFVVGAHDPHAAGRSGPGDAEADLQQSLFVFEHLHHKSQPSPSYAYVLSWCEVMCVVLCYGYGKMRGRAQCAAHHRHHDAADLPGWLTYSP